MRTRSCLVLLFLLFLVITLGLGAYVVITTAQKAALPAVSTPVATSTSTSTPTPVATATATPTLKDTITNIEGTIFDPIVAVLDYLAVVLIAALIILVVKLVWDYSGKTNLVIDAFTNASGDDTLEKVLPGLNQLTRLRLAEALEEVREDINTYNNEGLERLGTSPPPASTSNQQLSSLLKSLTDISSGNVKTAVQLLSLVFGPMGTEIVTTLHCPGDASKKGSLGMGVEIMDLEGRKEPLSLLFREPEENDPSPPIRHPDGNWHLPQKVLNLLPWNQQPKTPTEPKETLEERYLDLIWPVAYWLSVELAFRSMEEGRHPIRHFLMTVWKAITFQYVWRRIKKSGEWKSTYQARLYNYIGYFHLNNAQNYSKYGYSYDLAIDAFNKATTLDKNWFLPYENLGMTYLIMAQGEIKQAKPLQLTDVGIDDIYRALSSLRKANKLFQQHRNEQHISPDKLLEMEQFLKLHVCIVKLLSTDDVLIKESIDDILGTTRKWNLYSKINFRLLYNLACWYGVAYSTCLNSKDERLKDAQQRARRIIVCALARNVDFLYSASEDRSLNDIAQQEEWDRLESILKRKQSSIHDPDLSDREDYEFADAIYDILQQLQWQ